MIFSDHLSRNVDTNTEKTNEPTCKGLNLKIHDVYLNTSSKKCVSLAAETPKDSVLMTLNNQIIKGWPSQGGECLTGLIKVLELS